MPSFYLYQHVMYLCTKVNQPLNGVTEQLRDNTYLDIIIISTWCGSLKSNIMLLYLCTDSAVQFRLNNQRNMTISLSKLTPFLVTTYLRIRKI